MSWYERASNWLRKKVTITLCDNPNPERMPRQSGRRSQRRNFSDVEHGRQQEQVNDNVGNNIKLRNCSKNKTNNSPSRKSSYGNDNSFQKQINKTKPINKNSQASANPPRQIGTSNHQQSPINRNDVPEELISSMINDMALNHMPPNQVNNCDLPGSSRLNNPHYGSNNLDDHLSNIRPPQHWLNDNSQQKQLSRPRMYYPKQRNSSSSGHSRPEVHRQEVVLNPPSQNWVSVIEDPRPQQIHVYDSEYYQQKSKSNTELLTSCQDTTVEIEDRRNHSFYYSLQEQLNKNTVSCSSTVHDGKKTPKFGDDRSVQWRSEGMTSAQKVNNRDNEAVGHNVSCTEVEHPQKYPQETKKVNDGQPIPPKRRNNNVAHPQKVDNYNTDKYRLQHYLMHRNDEAVACNVSYAEDEYAQKYLQEQKTFNKGHVLPEKWRNVDAGSAQKVGNDNVDQYQLETYLQHRNDGVVFHNNYYWQQKRHNDNPERSSQQINSAPSDQHFSQGNCTERVGYIRTIGEEPLHNFGNKADKSNAVQRQVSYDRYQEKIQETFGRQLSEKRKSDNVDDRVVKRPKIKKPPVQVVTETVLNYFENLLTNDQLTAYEKCNLTKIYEILKKSGDFEGKVDAVDEILDNQRFYYLDENLQRHIEKLDRIDPKESTVLAEQRKNVIKFIYKIIGKLEEKANVE